MIVDAFSGADGWGVGARRLGLAPVGFELDADACATARAAGHHVVRQDVTTLSLAHLRGKVTGLIGSPPCTDFSKAGRRQGIRGKTGSLIFQMERLWSECRPEWIALEEVPEVLPFWRMFAQEMERHHGYRATWSGILDSADYGVPQNRRRAILIASRVRDVGPPPPTHTEHPHPVLFGESLKPWVSMAEALGWNGVVRTLANTELGAGSVIPYERTNDRPAPTLLGNASRWQRKPARTVCGNRLPRWAYDDNGPVRPLRDDPVRPAGDLRELSLPPETVGAVLNTRRDQREDGRTQTRILEAPAITAKASGQWAFERPATSVQCTDRIAKPGHHDRQWNGAVKVTLAELAILQSFPADYPWVGNKTSVARQIGNAIPPLMAMHVLAMASGIEPNAEQVA